MHTVMWETSHTQHDLFKGSFSISMTKPIFALIVASLLFTLANSSRGSTEGEKLELHGTKPDKFVAAAPLLVAASCKDGVAMVAVHGPTPEDELLMGDWSAQGEDTAILKDLPSTYRGPLRIHSLDAFGSALGCAGWRTDGDTLAVKCRSLAAEERQKFGEPNTGQDYGRFLAQEASFFMAQCACLDNSRSLSCVGLLSIFGNNQGYIWLVDATGSYQVRAHAVGNGSAVINERLRKVDFSSMTCKEGIGQLIKLMTQDSDNESEWKMPSKSRVEIAFLESATRRMIRVRQPFVVPVASF